MFCQNCGNKLKSNIKICPKCGYTNLHKKNVSWIVIAVSVLITISISLGLYGIYDKKFRLNSLYTFGISNKSYCDFEIKDVKEFRLGPHSARVANFYNLYLNSTDSNDYYFFGKEYWKVKYEEEKIRRTIYYEGVIKNNSSYPQYLKNIKTKLSTKNGLVIKEANSPNYDKILYPGDAIEFKTSIDFNTKEEVDRFFKNDNGEQVSNFYPWFETCDY